MRATGASSISSTTWARSNIWQVATRGRALRLQDLERLRVVIQQHQGVADRATRQQITGFIFLKRTRAAADDLTSRLLRQTRFFTDTPDLFRLQ
jgi:hypothetical protein